MKMKAVLMDSEAVNRALTRIAHEIDERNSGMNGVMLVGIRRRGVSLAKELVEKISRFEQPQPEYGELDITFYRDDLTVMGELPENHTAERLSVTGKRIVLVDDVIYTGRTVRAAIDALMDMGRPKCIQLAVLIDRGHRELPIRPDYVGKNVPTSLDEVVQVSTPEFDGESNVILYQKGI